MHPPQLLAMMLNEHISQTATTRVDARSTLSLNRDLLTCTTVSLAHFVQWTLPSTKKMLNGDSRQIL